jgi:hypothetical protein
VKRKISIILLAALLLAALAAVMCESPKFDNPLDKKGDNYLFGDKEDEEGKILTDDNGVAHLYTDSTYRPKCDLSTPEVNLEGPKTLKLMDTSILDFRKYMHYAGGGWEGVISWDETKYPEARAEEPRLTLGGAGEVNVPDKNKMPEPNGNYVIVYRIKNPECNGKVRWSEASRTLSIEKYIPPDTATPVIQLAGLSTETVYQGEKYDDAGVIVKWGGANLPNSALDSIVITGPGSYRETIKKPIADFSGVGAKVPTATVNNTYRIEYYATAPNGLSAAKITRTVFIDEKPVSGNPKAVIVLSPYKHVVGGKTIEHPDTMAVLGGQYTEKGVKRAFYVKDGNEVEIPNAANLTTKGSAPNLSGTQPKTASIAYNLDAGSGYAKADPVTRYIYAYDDGCEKRDEAPEVVVSGGDLEIPAGVPWTTYNTGWSVTAKDTVQIEPLITYTSGFTYIVDFDGGKLDPRNPKVGTYTIGYVGLSRCGKLTAIKTRAVRVK